MPLYYRGDDRERADLYALEMSEKTYGTLSVRAIDSLFGGHNVILDATFSKLAHRDVFKKMIRGAGFDMV